jgi:hypothetical protein
MSENIPLTSIIGRKLTTRLLSNILKESKIKIRKLIRNEKSDNNFFSCVNTDKRIPNPTKTTKLNLMNKTTEIIPKNNKLKPLFGTVECLIYQK